MIDVARANVAAAAAVVDELARSGVHQACLSPGSRSAPLAIALAHERRIRTWIITDERSAGFFALGAARESGRAVALVCTSGTAAANYAPAVVEASLAAVPLVLLTADRPTELRDCATPQTITQSGLFARHVLWEVELATPTDADLEAYYRTTACRAVAVATGRPRGPVHVNVPLREPLFEPEGLPAIVEEARAGGRVDGVPWTRVAPGRLRPDPGATQRLAALANRVERGALVCGPGPLDPATASAIVGFAEHCGWPILADPLSGVRHGPHSKSCVCDAYDVVLRSADLATRLAPRALVRIGGLPSSKPLQSLLTAPQATEQIAIAPDDRWRDPFFRVGEIMRGDVPEVLRDAAETARSRPGSAWLAAWQHASRAARAAIDRALDSTTPAFEGRIAREVLASAPDGTLCMIGNSTAVRDVDTFAGTSERLELVGNRGASGIDGLLSTALGAAAVGERPVLVLIGDLSYLHDIGALHTAQRHRISATVVVVNNDGGRIFSRLPQSRMPENLQRYFITPHGVALAEAAPLPGVRLRRVAPEQLREAVGRALATAGLDVLEVVVPGGSSAALHRACLDAASRDLTAAMGRAA